MRTSVSQKIILVLITLFFSPFNHSQVERTETGNLILENIPDIPQRIIEKMTRYQQTRSASFAGWLHNEKGILISTRFGETSQIHKVKFPGASREQITFFSEPVGGVRTSPDSDQSKFLYTKDIGGNEFYQIFTFNMADGAVEMITDGNSRNSSATWSNKGDKFVYSSTKRNGKDYDIYIANINDPKNSELLIEVSGSWSTADWSPDDSKLLVRNYISINESYYHIYDFITGELKQFSPSQDKISYGSAVWSKINNGVFYTSDEKSEFNRLRYIDLNSGSVKVITTDIDWDIGSLELNNQGTRLAFTVNEAGLSKLYLLDAETMKYH